MSTATQSQICDEIVEWGISIIDDDSVPYYRIDAVNKHRQECRSCDTLIQAAIDDAGLLSSFRWDDGQGGGYMPDDDEYDQSLDGEDDDGYEEDDYQLPDRRPSEDEDEQDDEEDEDLLLDGEDEADDEDDDEPGSSGPGSAGRGDEDEDRHRKPTRQGLAEQSHDDAERDDEEDAEADAQRKIAARSRQDEDDEEEEERAPVFSDEEREEMDAEAEAEADDLSDDDLADLDSQKQDDDDAVFDCVTDGIDAQNRTTESERRQAQEQVLADQDNETNVFGTIQVLRWSEGLASGMGMQVPSTSSAAATIRAAIVRSRGGHAEVSRGHRRGKLDGSALHKIARLDTRLFERKSAPSPRKLLVWVMVDCSGSMGGWPLQQAATVAKALAEAADGAPSVRLEVMGWSSPFTNDYAKAYTKTGRKRSDNTTMWSSANAGVVRLWKTGQPTARIKNLTRLTLGGTPDAVALQWAVEQMQKEVGPDETGMIIMASDGAGMGSLPEAVKNGRKAGLLVKSVAVGQMVSAQWQERVFGKDGYVEWRGSILATAKPIASMILKEVAPR